MFTHASRSSKKSVSVVALFALLLSFSPISLPTVLAANTDAVGTVSVDLIPNPSATSTKESVVISFSGTGTLNLVDWKVQDSNPTTYTFGTESLSDGESIKVCSGSGDDMADCDIDWTGSNVWNNEGDTLELLDENDAVIITITYGATTGDEEFSDSASVNYAPIACTPQFDASGPTNIQNTNSGDYFDSISDALADCDTEDGDIIELLGNISTSEQVTVNRPIVLEGNGYTIDASFTKTTNSNNSAIGVQSDNVNIKNVILDGANGTNLHGINVYTSTDVNISSVTTENFRTGLVVNGSTVNVSDITTDGNVWHAINVDRGSGVSEASVLNISNSSTHGEMSPSPNPHIFVDDIAKADITVNDLDDQYEFVDFPHPNTTSYPGVTARAYTLKESSTTTPVCDTEETTFDNFTLGSVDGQYGWSVTNENFDQEIVENTYGISDFGCKSFRISNAYTAGSFGDQTFSYSVPNEAGETSAENGGLSGGTRQNRFEASWDFASVATTTHQDGLSVTVSPDRGDGARMSWVQMTDLADGLTLNFYEYIEGAPNTGSGDGFVLTNLASGLDRGVPHNVKIIMDFVDGEGDDVVQVFVNDSLEYTGTSWEDYFRIAEGNPTRTVDSLLFRVSGTAAPSDSKQRFFD